MKGRKTHLLDILSEHRDLSDLLCHEAEDDSVCSH